MSKQPSYRVNEQIRIPMVRLIDDEGEQVGVVPVEEAIEKARDAGLDLVEVAPDARPPVCRVMDYGKFKYDQAKKARQSRANQQQLKEVRLRPKTDTHDLEVKESRARKFLESGDKVQLVILFRGREMAHMDLGRQKLLDFAERLSDLGKVERHPSREGRRMTMMIVPLKPDEKARLEKQREQEAEEAAESGEKAPQGDKASA